LWHLIGHLIAWKLTHSDIVVFLSALALLVDHVLLLLLVGNVWALVQLNVLDHSLLSKLLLGARHVGA